MEKNNEEKLVRDETIITEEEVKALEEKALRKNKIKVFSKKALKTAGLIGIGLLGGILCGRAMKPKDDSCDDEDIVTEDYDVIQEDNNTENV